MRPFEAKAIPAASTASPPVARYRAFSTGGRARGPALGSAVPRTGITLSELIHRVGNEGLLMLTALLTLVFLIPVSIPGVSTVFGAAILLIGLRWPAKHAMPLVYLVTAAVGGIVAGLLAGAPLAVRGRRRSRRP